MNQRPNADCDAPCHPSCTLGPERDHDGWRGYRCVGSDGFTLPFPGEVPDPDVWDGIGDFDGDAPDWTLS